MQPQDPQAKIIVDNADEWNAVNDGYYQDDEGHGMAATDPQNVDEGNGANSQVSIMKR